MEDGAYTPTIAANEFDITEEKAEQLLMELEEEGVLKYVGDDKYKLGSTTSAVGYLARNKWLTR